MRPPAEEPPPLLKEVEPGLAAFSPIALQGEGEGVIQAELDRGDGDRLRAGVFHLNGLDGGVDVDLLEGLSPTGVS